ncbi:hypothetical protein BD626DRAFT_574219 [Schizophyllum amplum]|uniref:F-box domain-containing protein n=1 Tax=Schizophyllum amplum TaxID=97359 RepID=A0A550BYU5_9AGAR|nr:hypothetical protein BD626DRAFT_574219 [Auriculariopsis ampla]
MSDNLTTDEFDDLGRSSSQVVPAVKHAQSLAKLTRNQHRALFDMLPSELLGHIFEFVLPYTADFLPTWPMFTRLHQQLVNITYVCRHWRDVARGSPSLWSVVDLCKVTDGPGGTPPSLGDVGEEFLRRSGSVPLTVFYITRMREAISTSAFRNLEPIVHDHGDRITHLHIRMMGSGSLTGIFSWPAPALCSLSLYTHGFIRDEGNAGNGVPLFSGQAPLLRKVAFLECFPSRVHRYVNNLTHIALYFIPGGSALDSLLDMLERSPRLEYLLIASTARFGPRRPLTHVAFGAARSIALPQLSELYFSGVPVGGSWLSHILSCVRVSENCDLRVRPIREEAFDDYTRPWHLSFLPSPISFPPLLYIDHVQIKISAVESPLECAVHSGGLYTTIDRYISQFDLPEWVTLGGMHSHLVLILVDGLHNNPTMLPQILLRWPALQSLEIVDNHNNTVLVCEALQAYKPDHAAATASLGLCHDLRRIDWLTTDCSNLEPIRAMAEGRMRSGAPLQEVQIRREISGTVQRSIYGITADVGFVQEYDMLEGEECLSVTDIVSMHSEALAPRLPDGSTNLERWANNGSPY